MGFKIENTATLANVNIRKEKHGDEDVTAVDLKFEVESAPLDVIFPLLGISEGEAGRAEQEAIINGLWNGDEPRCSGLDGVNSWAKYDHAHWMKGGITEGHRIEISKIKGFVFNPVGGRRVDLAFTVSISDPPDHLIEKAAACMKDLVELHIDHEPELPLDQAA